MGTTSNFDSPAAASVSTSDTLPIISNATSRAATATVAQLLAGAAAVVAVTAGATVLALTQAANAGRTTTIASTTPIAITLPASSGSGALYRVVLLAAATATAHTIKVANTVDAMTGLIVSLTTTAGVMIGFKNTLTDDTLTLNGTTTGGGIGAVYEFVDIKTGSYLVKGRDTAAMTTTPYSATV